MILRWWSPKAKRIGTKARASQVGRGMRITSVKQVVGRVEELRREDGPKPSGLFVQSILESISSCDGDR